MKKEIYIFGNGAMGTALACGLRNSSFEVIIVGRSKEKMEKLKADGFKTEFYTSGFDIEGKNIMFAFKSHALSKVTNFLSGRANSCISVLAMTSLEDIKKSVKSKIFAIAMPNIAAQFNKSLTPFVCEIEADIENPDVLNDLICEIIAGFGKPVEFESESVFNIAGIVSGCVPAYLSLVAEGLCEGCVREGLKAEVAYELIQGAFKSTTSLLNNFHPAILKDKICSPAGTTIKGVCSLEDDAIRASMIRAIKASRKKKS